MSTEANKELVRRYIQARVLQQVGALPGPPG